MKFFLALAQTLGVIGVFALAFLDSSFLLVVPGINDVVLISFVASKASWLWAIISIFAATVGSVLGAMMMYRIGQRSGSDLLQRKIPESLRERVLTWTQRFGALPVGVAGMLPPPCPYAPFVITAGVLNVPRARFGLSVGLGRGLRYTVETALAMLVGKRLLRHLDSVYWGALKTIGVVAIFALAIWMVYRYGIPRLRNARH